MSNPPNKIDFRIPELPNKRESNTSASTSPRHPEALNTDADDESSIDGSVQSSGSIWRTEAERSIYFKNQPECAELEPHRVLCTRCNSFVNLGRKRRYAVRPWELHRTKCDAQPGNVPHNTPKTDESGHIDTESTTTPSVMGHRIRRTEAERKAWLEADSRLEEIRPDRVKCRACKKWIKLSTKRPYTIYHWQRHRGRCGAVTPSSRVATAERKIRLVNDAQVKSFDTRQVECLQCGRMIVLEEDNDYDLVKWDEHKMGCPVLPRSIATEAEEPACLTDSVPFPIPDEENPPTSDSHSGINLKRVRSSSSMAPDSDDNRPVNRPRRESYVAQDVEAPSALGWILLPLKAFVRGFRESVKGDTQPRSSSSVS